ncbi:copper chaperone PCu(A)C [Pseudonocardia kujensis]|uniref:copper chaperone PCu(A)C n=1 Tax=Pseudonocardia kujensis TaxID=1128675 RepID=UPI001E630BB3|nr:copper chaperone PCu(A)C [Pseudonocardia kujensis]MCE0761413.1 copper chaperone PCu(A)C [Pseudonocardia kujensis]
MSRATSPRRSATRPGAWKVLAAGTAALGALLLSGCGAGQLAQTSEQVAAVGGTGGVVGDVAVRNAEIAWPTGLAPTGAVYRKGGQALVEMVIVNDGGAADRLVSASSAAGTQVVVTGEQTLAPQLPLVSGEEGDVAAIPGAKRVTVEIAGLRDDIVAGRTYPLTLVFEKAGPLTVDLPVANPTTPRQDEAPAEGAAEGGH